MNKNSPDISMKDPMMGLFEECVQRDSWIFLPFLHLIIYIMKPTQKINLDKTSVFY